MKKFIFEDEAEDLDILAEDDLDLVEDEENEEAEQVNEVRYIDPENVDKYDPNEIEEVTTTSGEKRYKRKTGAQAPAQKEEPDYTFYKKLRSNNVDWKALSDNDKKLYDMKANNVLANKQFTDRDAYSAADTFIKTNTDTAFLQKAAEKNLQRVNYNPAINDALIRADKAFNSKDVKAAADSLKELNRLFNTKEKKAEEPAQKSFNKDTARDYAKEFYRSIYGPNRNDSPYKDKKLDYTDELRDTANWPDSVNDIFDHQHNLLSTLYVQDQYASNDEEHKKYRQQYNSVFDDAAKAMKNVDEKERFKAIDDYYNNRYQSGGYASDPDGWRTAQVKSILQSFDYDINGKKDMRNAYKELKAKLS